MNINDIKAVYLLFNKAYLMFLALREMVRAVREGSCGSCMVRAVRKLHLWFVRLFLRTKSPLAGAITHEGRSGGAISHETRF